MVKEKLVEVDPNFGLIIQIWWAWMWRYIVRGAIAFVGLFVVAFILAFAVAAATGGSDEGRTILTIFGGVAGLCIGFWAWLSSLRAIFGKTFSGYRLVLLTPMAADATKDNAGY